MSTPITFPLSFTILADKNTSIPAPEPKSTTVSPSLMCTNFIGLPHPTPKIEAEGMAANSSELYPIDFADNKGDSLSLLSLQHDDDDDEGLQQESEFPYSAIFPYFSLIFS